MSIKIHESDVREISRLLGELSVYSPGAAMGFGGLILGLLVAADARHGGTVLVRTGTLTGADKATNMQKAASTNEAEKGKSNLLCTCGLSGEGERDGGTKATNEDK